MKEERPLLAIALPAGRLPSSALGRIQEFNPPWEVILTPDKEEFEKYLDRIEVIFGDAPFSLLGRLPRLKWVQLWSAGADRIQDYPELKKLPFLLTSVSGIHGRQMTEHLFGLILSHTRRLPEAFEAQKEKRWVQIGPEGLSDLAGKTLLIVGCGKIGMTAARAARGFGMEVIGFRRREVSPEERAAWEKEGIRLRGGLPIGEFLPQADYVVNILPLTPETRHYFNRNLFRQFKPGGVYVSLGRGGTTDEEALVEALAQGRLGGALLDVAETEPLREDSPLWEMKQVILTGHYAGLHREYDELALTLALKNLDRYLRGEPLLNLVDKERGY
ncbi:MAG: D-2-hydroxyacid dehydrogenase [Spirochaetales bacterium]|jgi:phosphoglycerate dehydrogenase-like enzyme|nr:D-2-hydroxyacid dehydrogenase [Spirochaetales bacterium]